MTFQQVLGELKKNPARINAQPAPKERTSQITSDSNLLKSTLFSKSPEPRVETLSWQTTSTLDPTVLEHRQGALLSTGPGAFTPTNTEPAKCASNFRSAHSPGIQQPLQEAQVWSGKYWPCDSGHVTGSVFHAAPAMVRPLAGPSRSKAQFVKLGSVSALPQHQPVVPLGLIESQWGLW